MLLLSAVLIATALPACSLSPEPTVKLAEATPGTAESKNESESKNPPVKNYEVVSFDLSDGNVLLAPGDIYFPGLLRVAFKNNQDNAHLTVFYDIYGRHDYYNNGRMIKAEVFRQLPGITFVLESSDPNVAVVEGSKLFAVSAGELVLTISLVYSAQPGKNGGAGTDGIPDARKVPTVKIDITVAIPITGVSATEQTIELEVGKTVGVGLLIDPTDASGVTLAFKSGDEGIATVDENGEITGVSAGETTIVVAVEDTVFVNRFVVEVVVMVKDPPPPPPSGGGSSGGGSGGGGSSGGGGGGSGGSSGGLTAAQYAEAYAIAAAIVSRHAGESETQMLASIASEVNSYYNQCRYTMDRVNDPYYDTAYGVFVAKTASCAGAVRAVNLCLSIAGYSYEHVNEWQYGHQWSRVYVASLNQYWVVDGGITGGWGLAAPEPAPYRHPWL